MAKFDAKSFNPQAFGKYVERIPKTRKNELIKSGVLKGNKEIRDAFNSQTGTAYAVLPMYGRIGGAVQNYDGETDIVAQSSTTYERGVVVIGRMGAWVEKDFSTDITGGVDFMDNVAAQVSEYFEDVDQDTLLAILKGIFAMTGAKNLEFVNNHTFDITGEEGEKGKAGPTTLNSAIQKASGDKKAKFTMAIMHSVVATNLENLQLLAYLKYTDANGVQRDLTLASWNGRVVLIDDNMPTEEVEAVEESGTKGQSGYVAPQEAYTKYTTYLLGDGAIDYENVGVKVPYEMDRNPAKNGGEDTLYAKQRKVFAPYGISYTKKVQAKLSPTDVELSNGANWELVNDGGTGANKKYIDDKQIYIARIISKG